MKRIMLAVIPFLVALLALGALLAGLHQSAQALDVGAVWTVCRDGPPACDYENIQEAVDAAVDDDLIQVAEGKYVDRKTGDRELVFLNKSVTIRGGYTVPFVDPPDPLAHPTILDARGNGRVFYIEYAAPTLDGLVITGGDAQGLEGTPYGGDAGGGLYVDSSRLILQNSLITGNLATVDGGGIYNTNSLVTITHSTIADNQAMYGAGIYIWYSTAYVAESRVMTNTGEGSGGVWMGVYSSGRFEHNLFTGNLASGTTNETGGGLLAERSTIVLNGNTFRGNTAQAGGGGAVLIRCNAWLTNNIFADNRVETSGGALLLNGTSARLVHNTVARSQGSQTSGIYLATHWEPVYSGAVMVNTILVGNPVGIFAEPDNWTLLDGTLWGNGEWANGSDWAGEGDIMTGTVNLWEAPAFVNPTEGDYHLLESSPAVNAGLLSEVTTDIDGDQRPSCVVPDLGADEVILPSVYAYLPLAIKE